jgi:hypothetical protein
MFKKYEIKIWCTSPHSMFVNKFSWQNNILYVVYKNTQKILYIVMLENRNLSFFTRGTKKFFFMKTCVRT